MDIDEENYFLTRGKAILIGLVLLVVIIIFAVVKGFGSKSTENYKEYETELKNAAESYYEINELDIEDGEIKRVSMNEVLKVYSTDNELKDKCTGYVIISSEKYIASDKYEITFSPYIKCGKRYITPNYSEY